MAVAIEVNDGGRVLRAESRRVPVLKPVDAKGSGLLCDMVDQEQINGRLKPLEIGSNRT